MAIRRTGNEPFTFGPPEIMNTGISFHVLCSDRSAAARAVCVFDGRKGPISRQHLHQAAMADAEYECVHLRASETGSKAKARE